MIIPNKFSKIDDFAIRNHNMLTGWSMIYGYSKIGMMIAVLQHTNSHSNAIRTNSPRPAFYRAG